MKQNISLHVHNYNHMIDVECHNNVFRFIAKKLFILFSGISYNFSWHTCDNSEIGYIFSDNRIYTYYTTSCTIKFQIYEHQSQYPFLSTGYVGGGDCRGSRWHTVVGKGFPSLSVRAVWQHIEIRCSNSLVLGPVVIHPERRASATSHYMCIIITIWLTLNVIIMYSDLNIWIFQKL